MWFDEIWTVKYAINPPSEIPSLLVKDDAPPMYAVILHYWMMLGSDAYPLRFLSVFFGVLMIYLAYALGNSIFNSNVGLFGSALSSISVLLVQESQTVRPYTLFGFFTLASLYFFYNGLTAKNVRSYWIGYVLSTLISIYLHYFGFLNLFSELIFFILYHQKHRSAKNNFTLSILLILLLYSPWMSFFIQHSGSYWHEKNISVEFSYQWIKEKLLLFYRSLALMSNTKYLIPIFILLIAFQCYSLSSDIELRYKFNLFLILFIVSFSPMFFTRTFHTKFVIYLTPLYYTLAANGFLSVKNNKIKYLFAFILLSGSFMTLSVYYSSEIADWRSVAEYIRLNAKPDDIVLVEPSSERMSFNYYFLEEKPEVLSLTEYDGTPGKLIKVLSRYPDKNVWLVYTNQNEMRYDANGKITSFIERNMVNKTSFSWITVYLLNSTSTKYTAN
jgi:uncharacterized membrane protein